MYKRKEWTLQPYKQWRLPKCPIIWELWKKNEYGSWNRFDWFYTKNEALLKCAIIGISEDDLQKDF